MALPINARFIAAAVLSGMLIAPQALALGSGGQPAAPVQLADNEAGKEKKEGEATKKSSGQAGGKQTAKKPAQRGGGEEGGFGVERPAPEGPDPNAPEGGGDGASGKSDLPPGDE